MNGTPGTHHVEARAFKDVFPRYRTTKGYYVPRQAGWYCHGLPVELTVEKELGFNGKQDIEAYGVAEFNELRRESVLLHVGEFAEMTRHMGCWVEMDSAYWTMEPKTPQGYESTRRNIVAPRWADVQLRRITVGAVKVWTASCTSSEGNRLGDSKTREAVYVLEMILDHAVDCELIARNPAMPRDGATEEFLPGVPENLTRGFLTESELRAVAVIRVPIAISFSSSGSLGCDSMKPAASRVRISTGRAMSSPSGER